MDYKTELSNKDIRQQIEEPSNIMYAFQVAPSTVIKMKLLGSANLELFPKHCCNELKCHLYVSPQERSSFQEEFFERKNDLFNQYVHVHKPRRRRSQSHCKSRLITYHYFVHDTCVFKFLLSNFGDK